MSEDEPRNRRDQNDVENAGAPEEDPDEGTEVINRPLTPDEFRDALSKLDALGLTWSADPMPRIRARTTEAEDALFSEELSEIQRTYPRLQREVGLAVFKALTGSPAGPAAGAMGGEDSLNAKVEAVNETLNSNEYRAEFFFKHAIKVPYFSDVDWEIVVKAFEKNVQGIPGVAYALLSLKFHDPDLSKDSTESETKTVAVDERLVDRLIQDLSEVKNALKRARRMAVAVESHAAPEDESDA